MVQSMLQAVNNCSNPMLNFDMIWTMLKDTAAFIFEACSLVCNYSKKLEDHAHHLRSGKNGWLLEFKIVSVK